MKKFIVLTAFVLAGAMLLTACAPGAQNTDTIYRGEVTSISENGDILVTQVAGHNYGQASILFHVSSGSAAELGSALVQGAFVEVHYNGALTRSIPAQGTADGITVIASYSEGIVQNGSILSVTVPARLCHPKRWLHILTSRTLRCIPIPNITRTTVFLHSGWILTFRPAERFRRLMRWIIF